jgi:glycine dehydrogenase subunit 1
MATKRLSTRWTKTEENTVRYLPHSEDDIRRMLTKIGVDSVDELFEQIPEALRFEGELNLPEPLSEPELMTHLYELAGAAPAGCRISFLGAGAYAHHLSPVVDQLLMRSEFYTAYTPYQPEVSQGTLQAIFEFQTMVCRIFGMGVSNASMYDGATAAAEAVLMARRVTKKERVLVSAGLHPEYVEVIRTYLTGLDGGAPKVEMIPLVKDTGLTDLNALANALGNDTAAIVMGYPNFFGVVDALGEATKLARQTGAMSISATAEPFAFGLITPPGDMGVDIAVGEGQPLGIPVSFGGPGLGLFSCREDRKLLRQMPGRLCGQTEDVNGNTGYVLTLATREQHIRREKATSNICTNHGLCALAVTVNLSLLGKTGFEQTAKSCFSRAEYLKKEIGEMDGFSLKYTGPTFSEFAVRCHKNKAAEVLAKLADEGFLGGVDLGRFDKEMDDTFLMAVTECHTRDQLDGFLQALAKV